MASKELTELIRQRDRLFGLLQERRALGAFDVHAGTLIAIMESVLAIMNYQITTASKPDSRAQS